MNNPVTPNHIAIIMDGNGRWATKRGLSRTEGHKKGVETVRTTVKAASELGVKYLTLFGFSSENWNRPQDEVSYLMDLIRIYLKKEISELNKNGVCLKIIGDRSRLAHDIVNQIEEAEKLTANNDKITVIMAISYGGRQDIVEAAMALAAKAVAGEINPAEISEASLGDFISTAGIPDPDLMIRTSGEQRISNFLIWQLAYTELYFTDTYWPDFDKQELQKAIEAYKNRDRRYGKISDKAMV